MAGPLEGVRVLDLTRVLAGPHATRVLADMGADVIKVEPPAGDLTRFAFPRVNHLSTYFVQQNTGKRNVSIDLGTPRGVELVLALASHCDVLVENFRAGVMDRLGLGPAVVRGCHPGLVYVSITGYGATGPWRHRRAYAPVIGAEAGITKAQADARGGDYANDPFSHADLYTAKEVVAATLAALFQRTRTGEGQWIDVSMAETMLYVNEHLHDQLAGVPDDPTAIRSFRPGDYLVLRVASGESVVVSGHPAERGTFDLLVAGLSASDVAGDPRFVDAGSRMRNLDALRRAFVDAAAAFADTDSLERSLAAHGLAMGVVRDARDLAESDWARQRGAITAVPDRGGGTIRVPNPPWHFSGADTGVRGEPRFRGEDNRAVLAELLGYDDATIDALEADGVLSNRPPPP